MSSPEALTRDLDAQTETTWKSTQNQCIIPLSLSLPSDSMKHAHFDVD